MVNSKVYLNVPYAEKDAAKALGAKWDPAKKKWFAPANTNISCFSKWQTNPATLASKVKNTKSDRSANSSFNGTITYPKDKNFVAYNGELPPWD